ncbi:MAG: fatty acid--CoA ligase family protein [Acidimicrobiales bacterium]
MNLSSLLTDHPADDDTVIVSDLDRSFTRAELVARVEVQASAIADLSPIAGAPAAVVAAGIEMLVGMFAVWRNGLVLVPVNPRQPPPSIGDVIERTDAAVVIDEDGIRSRPSTTVHDTGTAFVLWTSGTTGRPKAVLHEHDAYLEIIDRVLGPLRAAPRDPDKRPSPNLIPVSMALNAGLYNALFGLRAGAPLVLMERFETRAFATLVDRHQIRSTVLPPAAMAMLSDDAAIDSLAPLRYVRSITAPLSPFQARRFTGRFGVTVLNGYGQAEIGEVIGWTAADAKAHPDKIGAIGRPHAGVDIRLDEPDELGVGELLVRPPNRATGYADKDDGNVDLADRLTPDGFVRTGDLARIDDDGFVWIEGRQSDLINRGGNKVFPDEVEEVLLTVPGVREAAVVAAPDSRLGEVPVAFIVGTAAAADLESACRDHLVAYKVPARFEWCDALPRNEAGKVLRKELVAASEAINHSGEET